ncbi:MAG: hypothetical protein JXN59_11300, partial [Anaerolineae bacterium]|nr:hypothetical protein [Anaerolineae bacterium]
NTDTLIAGDIAYIGTFDFRVEGDQERAVYLGLKEESPSFSLDLAPLGNLFSADGQTELRWNVGLSPAIPLTLDVDGGVGDATLLLDELQLDRLDVNAGVGNVTISLPAGEYRAALDGGVGDFMISIAPGANITLDVNGGVGESTIDVPDDAAVRVETDGGLGDVSVPRGYTQISSRDDDIQVWETDGFAQADETITILYEGGIGGLTIR